MEIKKGKILGFHGTWGSGLGYITIENIDTKIVETIPCENAPTVRALDSAFGNVIIKDHMVNNEAIKGKEIFYSISDFGLLEGFTPVEEAGAELLEKYEKEKKKLKEVI